MQKTLCALSTDAVKTAREPHDNRNENESTAMKSIANGMKWDRNGTALPDAGSEIASGNE